MIPDAMIAANPALGKTVEELVNKKMCRFCLSESENLVDIVELEGQSGTSWKTILVTCFSASVTIADQLPKFVCEKCCAFVKQCHEFQKLRRKAEWLLMSYPLLGSWTQSLDVPEWLRPAKKRQLEEMIVDSASVKKVCVDQSKGSGDKEDSYNVTIELLGDSEVTPIGSIRVRSQESLAVASTLQSPTITSEDNQLPVVPQRASVPQLQYGTEAVQSRNQQAKQQCPDQTVIQYCQPQQRQHHNQLHQNVNNSQYAVNPSSTQYLQYQSSYTFVQPYQQVQQPAPPATLRQQLQQPPYLQYPSSQYVYSQNQPTPMNTSSPQTPTHQPYQPTPLNTSSPHQPYQQQVVPTYQPAPQTSTPQQPAPVQQTPHPSTTWYPPAPSSNLRCTICPYQFADPNHLNFHMRKHIGRQQFRCIACEERFPGLTALVAHIGERHLRDCSSYCCLCGEQYQQLAIGGSSNEHKMMEHLKQHLTAKLAQACDFCPMVFTNRNARMEHVSRQHRAETWQVKLLNSNQILANK